MDIHTILTLANSLEGPILEVDFTKGEFSYKVLDAYKRHNLQPKEFTLLRRSDKALKRYAIDFRANISNYHNSKATIIEGEPKDLLKSVITNSKPSIIYLSTTYAYKLKELLKDTIQSASEGSIVVINTEDSAFIKNINKFCKLNFLNFSLANEGDFAYIIKGDTYTPPYITGKIKPLSETVSNKVKRDRSENLT